MRVWRWMRSWDDGLVTAVITILVVIAIVAGIISFIQAHPSPEGSRERGYYEFRRNFVQECLKDEVFSEEECIQLASGL